MHSYLVEGVGEDFWPTTFDRDVVDRWIRVSDREAFAATRRIAREEGILIGASGGMALHAALLVAAELPPDQTVLVILPDGGRPYLSKVFNDDWMLVHGMFDDAARPPTAGELVAARSGDVPALVSVEPEQPVADAIALLQRFGVSQLPVIADGEVRAACTSARCSTARCATGAERSRRRPRELMSEPAAGRAVDAAPRRRLPRPPVEPGRARRRRQHADRRADPRRRARVARARVS